jgi:hypothetical protein
MKSSGPKIAQSCVDRYKYTRGRERKTAKLQHLRRDNAVLPCILSGVKLPCLGCRSSVGFLRRVPVLLVFYSSTGLNRILSYESLSKCHLLCRNYKGKNSFSCPIHIQIDYCQPFPRGPFDLTFPSYCDVARARIFLVHCTRPVFADVYWMRSTLRQEYETQLKSSDTVLYAVNEM